ncbi:Pex13 protein [Ophiocordyceps camponoti-floridani]|uniref:Peroxisomal membrane protein PEX13 n=1 Tax=Ophiocordyceps camponoti-floridani TaxID=2030778 RepID=A0A8H4VFI1_9HYPO|nr:Pex13 protein [Ophiocordyceps camponoti-floridani]
MASPPKPWERPGAGAASTVAFSPASTSTPVTAAASSTSDTAPPLPERPSSLASTVNQNAAAYSRMGAGVGVGASPYGGYGGAYSSPYSSPYSRFGGYGGGMYGGYGGYGGGMYGGGMYGGMGGMPGGQNDPNSLTNRFNNGTAATFQMLEGIVTAFAGFSQMLESTYMATHSSFFAMVSVAEQFGNLRDTLGSILGIFTLMRWIRTLIAKLTGRPPPADATALTPAAFARFEGRRAPAPRKQANPHAQAANPSSSSSPPLSASPTSCGLELQARKADLVAVLSKKDPVGNASEWWLCRSRDGRQGYLPCTYLELLRRPGSEVKTIQAADVQKSVVATAEEGKKEYATADGMQRSHFYS